MTGLVDRLPGPETLQSLALAQFWQVTLLAAVVGLAATLVARRRPHLAYLVWMLVVVKCLTPPIWASPTGAFSWLAGPAAGPVTSTQRDSTEQSETPASAEFELSGVRQPAAIVPLESSPVVVAEQGWRDWTALLGPLWLLGSALLATAVFWQNWRYRRRLRQSAVPTDAQVKAVVAALAARLGIRRQVQTLVARDSLGPAALGLLRPTIVLPEALVATASPAELELVVAHELVHHRRGDVLAGWLQLAAQLLWWFHPLVWWANRSATRQRELACDEEVVAGLGCDPSTYAQGLIGVLELRRALRPLFAPAMRPVDVSRRRLEWILNDSAQFHRRTPRWCWLAVGLLALVTLPGAASGRKSTRNTATRSALHQDRTESSNPSGTTAKPKETKTATDLALQGSPQHQRAVMAIRELGGKVDATKSPDGQVTINVTIAAGWKEGPDGLRHLAQFDHLERLRINDILAVVADKKNGLYRYRAQYSVELRVTDDWLAPLAGIKTLKALEVFNNCRATDAGLAHLAELVNLEILAIGGQGITDAGMVHLAPLTKLQQLYLHDVKITDAGLVQLAGAKKLELLNITSDQFHGEGFKALAGLERLDDLGLQYCPIFDQGLEAISQLKLKRLLLGKHQLTDAGLVYLRDQAELETLVIEEPQHAEFSGAGLAHLSGLKSLRDFRYATKKLAADDLAALAGLDQLTLLMLNAPVTDAGLVHVARLAQLKFLYLLGAELTDVGLQQLYGLKKLKNLVLPAKDLSEEAKAALQQTLPTTEITWLPNEAK